MLFFLEGVPFGLAEALQAWSVGHLGLLQFMGLAQEACSDRWPGLRSSRSGRASPV
jgi:hypothetical protein